MEDLEKIKMSGFKPSSYGEMYDKGAVVPMVVPPKDPSDPAAADQGGENYIVPFNEMVDRVRSTIHEVSVEDAEEAVNKAVPGIVETVEATVSENLPDMVDGFVRESMDEYTPQIVDEVSTRIPTQVSQLENDMGYTTTGAMDAALAHKQDTIQDLSDIRSGAEAGAAAVQPGDLATVATSGSYNDLKNRPTIPAEQVNSDWNASSGVAEILHKPQLAAVATTGDYGDLRNKPSIPEPQVNADWNADSGVAKIENKPELASVATSGNYSDLAGKPSIPSKTSDLDNDSGFITAADIPGSMMPANEPPQSGSSYVAIRSVNGSPGVGSSQWKLAVYGTGAGSFNSYSINTETQGIGLVVKQQAYNNARNGQALCKNDNVGFSFETINGVPSSAAADSGKVLTVNAQGAAAWNTLPGMAGATASEAGSAGAVPAPAAGDQGKFLKGDGTWGEATNLTPTTEVPAKDRWYVPVRKINQADDSVSTGWKLALYATGAGESSTYTVESTKGQATLIKTSVVTGASTGQVLYKANATGGTALGFKTINEVPSSAAADSGKVLTVNAQGTAAWATPAAQVNSDWNAESGAAQILNKPIIPVEASVEDIDAMFVVPNTVVIGGRRYRTVTIGNLEWLAENLDYKFDYNGGQLPVNTDTSPETPAAWYYNKDEETYGIDGTYKCGLLYNWYAVDYLETNKATLLPDGWRVSSKQDWHALCNAIGYPESGSVSSGGPVLKAADNTVLADWPSGWNGTDTSGLGVLPAGNRNTSFGTQGTFSDFGREATYWCTDTSAYPPPYGLRAFDTTESVVGSSPSEDILKWGYSVRLVRTIS